MLKDYLERSLRERERHMGLEPSDRPESTYYDPRDHVCAIDDPDLCLGSGSPSIDLDRCPVCRKRWPAQVDLMPPHRGAEPARVSLPDGTGLTVKVTAYPAGKVIPCDCCDRADEYNGIGAEDHFTCPLGCPCHD